jgi:hypothetical protein
MQRDGGLQLLQLVTESISQPGKSVHAQAHDQVLVLNQVR